MALIFLLTLCIGIEVGIFVSILYKIGNQTAKIADSMKDVEIIEYSNVCSHEIAPCEYYYDDDWGFKGREIFEYGKTLGKLCYCKKCGALFVNRKVKAVDSVGENV